MDNPESPSFNRPKKDAILESYNDSLYWKAPISKLPLFEDDELKLFSKDPPQDNLVLASDPLSFKGLGVNGTVRRFDSRRQEERVEEKLDDVASSYHEDTPAPLFSVHPENPVDLEIHNNALTSTPFPENRNGDYLPSTSSTTFQAPRFVSTTVVHNHYHHAPTPIVLLREAPVYYHWETTNQNPALPSVIMNSPVIDYGSYSEDLGQNKSAVAVRADSGPYPTSHALNTGNAMQPARQTLPDIASSHTARIQQSPDIASSRPARIQQPPDIASSRPARIQQSNNRPSLEIRPEPKVTSNSTLLSLPEKEEVSPREKEKTIERKVANEEESAKKERNWFRWLQVFRSLAMTTHTWISVFPGLTDPRVQALNGVNLLIAILVFTALDVLIALIRAFPKKMWVFWEVRNWDPVKALGTVWSIIADHALLLDIVPMFANLTLRVYSYRLTELVGNPDALNSINNNGFTFSSWNNPAYNNFVQLILWGTTLLTTILFHTVLRMKMFAVKYNSPSFSVLIGVKASLLLFDMLSSSLFLYTFLVSLGTGIFSTFSDSPNIPLMLSIMITSPIISTVCNSLINVPLLYCFERIVCKPGNSALNTLKIALNEVFSPLSLFFSIFALFYIAVTAYLLNQLQLISYQNELSTLSNSFLQGWSPKQGVIWVIAVNYAFNYILGMAVTSSYWSFSMFIWIGSGGKLCRSYH